MVYKHILPAKYFVEEGGAEIGAAHIMIDTSRKSALLGIPDGIGQVDVWKMTNYERVVFLILEEYATTIEKEWRSKRDSIRSVYDR